ncbi:response regulator [Candidatus Nitrososphaera sp. FF02]|uniref:response regulator n=1 Tax=Candidatus Nitrososphaera sp. FF02 TaxID=3398226 RepID=UPI0039EAC704
MGLKILVAEDDRSMSGIYKISLEAKGHHTTITNDGDECAAVYREAVKKLDGKPSKYEPFDVVVLDYRMPKMDGLAAAKEILKMNPDQRIIFASAYVKETLRDSVRELEKVVELIQKPFEPKILVELIENTATIKELEEINKMVTDMDGSKSDDAQINELLAILKRVQKVGF